MTMLRLHPALHHPRSRRRGGLALLCTALTGCLSAAPPENDVDLPTSSGEALASTEAIPELAACERHIEHLPGEIAIEGCAGQIEAVRRSPPDGTQQSVDEVSSAPAGMLVEPGKRLHDCEWHSFTDVAKVMMVTCPEGSHVVSGGCMSQTPMLVSAPWENNTAGDLPEDAERYQHVGDPNGWLCIYEDPYPSGQKATALCCE